MVCNAQLQNLREGGKLLLMSWWNMSKRWTSSTPRCQCVKIEGFFKRKGWKVYDPLQCRVFQCTAFISHSSLSKSPQYLRSSSEWCEGLIDSADTWSNALKHGEIHCEGERSVVSKMEPQQVDALLQTPNEEWSSSRTWWMVERDPNLESLRICGTVWRQDRSMQGVFSSSWRSRFRTHCMYRRTHQNWFSSSSQNSPCCFGQYGIEIQVPSTSEEGSKSLIMISWMIQITLQKVVNLRIIQAAGDRTRCYQAPWRLVRHSLEHIRIWRTTIPMIFLPIDQKEVEW